MNEASPVGTLGSKFYDDAAFDGITLRFSEGSASDDGDGLTKIEGVVDPPADL